MVIPRGKFHFFFCLNIFGTRTILKKVQFSFFSEVWPLFKRPFLIKCTKNAYIHDQRVKINQNQHFVFEFTSLPVLTVFSNVSSTGSWWRRKLNYNPTPSNECRYSHVKFQENRSKTVAVTVPSIVVPNIMAAVTSLIM